MTEVPTFPFFQPDSTCIYCEKKIMWKTPDSEKLSTEILFHGTAVYMENRLGTWEHTFQTVEIPCFAVFPNTKGTETERRETGHMTDAHRQFFADLYHFYERHEQPPDWSEDPSFSSWWNDLMKDGEQLAAKWKDDPAAFNMIAGVIDGIQDRPLYSKRQTFPLIDPIENYTMDMWNGVLLLEL